MVDGRVRMVDVRTVDVRMVDGRVKIAKSQGARNSPGSQKGLEAPYIYTRDPTAVLFASLRF